MAGNMQPVRVSAAGLFTFRLKKGSTVLLEEDYVPDASGQAEIDIRDLVLSDLSLSLPSADVFKQTAAAASYTISTDTDSRTFKAVLGGIDRPATDAATFLKTNFLTWQPQLKSVTYGQPEWLSFYTPATAVSLKAKFYLKDGTTSTVTVAASFDPGCVYSVNVRFSRLWSMGKGDRYGMVDVWLEDDQSTALTYVQRYVLDTSGDERTVLVARNSLGGIDTFSFLGSMERSAEAEHTNVMRGETMFSGLVDMTRTYTVNTGILSGHGRDWVWDLQRSPQAWVLMDGALRGIVMLAPAVTASMYEDSTGTVDFLLCDDSGYLNMPRLESLPENIEVPGPDGEIFFLAPRLADYPDASLDGPLLLPVQSPAAQEWSKLSVAALSSYILSAVDDKYGEFLHVHDNLPVLGKLSVDDNGRLMYDGEPVGGSGLTEHDHHGETIRPEKIVVGTVEITCVDGRLHVSSTITSDGDFVAYGDEEGGEAGGGLDVARLWEELKAEDASKVIDVSHIPGSVVLQDELTEILDDYPLTTEVNTALGGKADKDWVEEELAKYLLLTGGKISGDLEVTGTLKIGDAVLSYADGRLHVSSTVTSDGDFVAYGDDEGGEAGGGLDVARLWEELKAEDASKVIDVSHIPGSVVLQDELTEILDDYPLITEMNTALAGKASLQHSHAITDITSLQAALSSKWVWNASQIAGVKVNNAVAADKLATARKINGTSFSGELDIVTDKWGNARTVTIWDYCSANKQATQGVDGSVNVNLLLPQSIKVKTLDVDGVTLSVVDGRLHISATATSAGDFVAYGDEAGSSGSGGLDISRLWDELRADDSSKVIDISHIPSIPTSKITGLDNALASYATRAWVQQQGYLTSVSLATISDLHSSWDAVLKAAKPAWLTTVSLSTISDLHSSWDAVLKVAPTKYVTRWPTASEVGALTQTAADGRYLRLAGGTMSGDITFSAGAIYLGTADGFDRTIVGYNETSGAMLFFDGTRTVIGSYGAHSTAATHIRSKTGHATIGAGNTASYTILDSGNIGSYALTKSNYASTLDSRYVNVSGDTLTGPLKFVSNGNRYLTLSDGGLRWDFSDVTTGYAHNWLGVTEPDGSSYTGMGVYGTADGLNYIYLGGSYTAPWVVLKSSGNVGIGITSPTYKLHVGGNAYISGTIYASSSFNLTSNKGRFVFDSSSDATWLQGMEDKRLGISGFNGTTLPRLDLVADDTYATGDFRVGGSVKIGSIILTDSGGRLHVSSTITSDGDFVAFGDEEGSGGSGGLDVTRLWEELVAKDSGKVIDITHIPSIPVDKVTGLSGAVSTITKANLTASRALVSNASGKVAVSAVTATELGYLDGVTSNIQSQLNGKQAAGSYVTTNTAQDVTGLKTFARDAASVLYVENTAATSTSKYSAIVFQRAGSNIGIIAAGVDTNYLYRANPAFSTVYTILDTGNYTSALDSRYMRIGSSGYPTAYRKVFNLNGTAWSFLGTTTDAPTAYAPTTAGTSGYVLQSTGGTPAWAAQNSLVVKGIYERNLGVAAGDTMADLKSALTTQMGSGLNKPGSMGFVTATSVANIMSNWANDDYELVAGARTNFLRLDGYGSSIYGVFLVSGYQGSFYRLLKNSSTAWAGPYLILDTGNYASTLDSRYVNISGDTMTGRLTLGDSSRLDLVVGGTTRTAVYDDGDYTIFGDPNYKACIRGSRIIFQNATGSNGLVMEGDTFTFKGNSIWHAGNDGPGSGLNADLLDGYQASSFLLKSGGTMNAEAEIKFDFYAGKRVLRIKEGLHWDMSNTNSGYANVYAIHTDPTGASHTGMGIYGDTNGLKYFYLGGSYTSPWMVLTPSGYVGIGTTSPAYKLDVAGRIRATSGITIGSTNDIGWYENVNRITAGYSTARGVNVGSLLVSNAWADYTKVPTNGIYSKGDIWTGGKLFVPSSEGNKKYYLRFE